VAASIRLDQLYRQSQATNELLFCLFAGVVGIAAITFSQSQRWDLAWWSWNLLRLTAYGLALGFVVRYPT